MSNRDKLISQIDEIRTRESNLMSMITGKTISQNFPFRLFLLILTLAIPSFMGNSDSYWVGVLTLVFVEWLFSGILIMFRDRKYRSVVRDLLENYVNEEYKNVCILSFPKIWIASLLIIRQSEDKKEMFAIINGVKVQVVYAQNVEIYMDNTTIDNYIKILLDIEENLGAKL